MGGPVVNKVVTTPVKPSAEQTGTAPAKVGESKFDKVRASLQDSQASEVKMPPEVRQVSTEQRKMLKDHFPPANLRHPDEAGYQFAPAADHTRECPAENPCFRSPSQATCKYRHPVSVSRAPGELSLWQFQSGGADEDSNAD